MERSLRILIADDSPTQAALLKMGLHKKGYEIIMAKDGIEAVEAAYGENPDLIVSDIVMPRLNGYQVCRLLKDDQIMSWMPIILLTSLDEKADMFWGMKSGADLYLTKDRDVSVLVTNIEKFIKERKLISKKRKASHDTGAEVRLQSHDIIGRVIKLLDKNLFESTILNDIGDLVNILDEYRKIMFSVLEILSKVIDFDAGILTLIGDEDREYYVYVHNRTSESYLCKAQDITDNFIIEEIGATRLSDRFTVETNEPEGPKPKTKKASEMKIRSYYLKKLETKGYASGVIGLFSHKANAFTDRMLHTFNMITPQANIVIDYARLYEKNKKLSITDGLTKVYNHRYFQESLKLEFGRSVRHKSKMALIMLDIDHFKSFNDTYGHQQGDLVLSELARLLKKTVRTLDIVSRYGGEEFAIIMPDAGPSEAVHVAERIRKVVERHEFPGKEKPLKVTVSIGLSAVPNQHILSATIMINSADKALYKAKNNGRNRVEKSF